MAAINNKARNRHLLMMLPVFLFTVFGYQNCAVDMAATTPGAASVQCEPDATTLAEFETIFNNTLNSSTGTFASGAQKCASCHGNSVNPNGEGGYVIFQGNTTSDPTLVKRNYCAAFDVGQSVVNHPMTPSHGGGQYPESDIQDLVTFALSHF